MPFSVITTFGQTRPDFEFIFLPEVGTSTTSPTITTSSPVTEESAVPETTEIDINYESTSSDVEIDEFTTGSLVDTTEGVDTDLTTITTILNTSDDSETTVGEQVTTSVSESSEVITPLTDVGATNSLITTSTPTEMPVVSTMSSISSVTVSSTEAIKITTRSTQSTQTSTAGTTTSSKKHHHRKTTTSFAAVVNANLLAIFPTLYLSFFGH